MFNPFRLKKPIGEAFNMDLDDALNAKKALSDLGHMKVSEDGVTEFPDRPMLDGIRSFQREQGLKVDGVMKPDGPTIERLNKTLVARQKGTRPPGPISADPKPAPSGPQVHLINLKRPITPMSNVDLSDTGQVKRALNDLGLLDTRTHGLDEFPDEPMFAGIKAFQRQQGLKVDGEMRPAGETEGALNKILQQQVKREYPYEKDQGRVDLAFAPAVPIGMAFAEWLVPILAVATVAAARAAFSALARPRQQELRKRYREETGNDDDEDDFCLERFLGEQHACNFRPEGWKRQCLERAAVRYDLCNRNGGVPDPEEPDRWSERDEEVGFSPR